VRARNYILAIALPALGSAALTIFVVAEPGASELIPLIPVVSLFSLIGVAVLLYRMWDAIQDGVTSPGPGMAWFGLLIPLFNLYWVFRVWAGWPAAYAGFVERSGRQVPPVSRSPFVAMVVLSYVAPVAGLLAVPFTEARRTQDVALLLFATAVVCSVISLVLFFVVINRACTAVNNLKAGETGTGAPA